MKLVFIIDRTNHYRHYGSLISEGLIRGHSIECWHDYRKRTNGIKDYLFPHIELSPFYLKGNKNILFKKIEKNSQFSEYILSNDNVDYFIAPYPITTRRLDISNELIDKLKNRWCTLMLGMDNFVNMRKFGDANLYDYNPIFLSESKRFFNEGLEWMSKHNPSSLEFYQNNKTKILHIGSTILTKKFFKKNSGKKKKRKLVYLPFPYLPSRYGKNNFSWQAAYSGLFINYYKHKIRNKLPVQFVDRVKDRIHKVRCFYQIIKDKNSRRYFKQKNNEVNVARAIRAFCNKNNLEFVVKPRKKFPIIEPLFSLADEVIYDDESQRNPSLLQKLFNDTSIVVGGLTSAVGEVIFNDIPFVNIEIPDFVFLDQWDKFLYDYNNGSFYNYDKVVYNFKIEDFIKTFSNKNIQDFELNENNKKKFLKEFYDYEGVEACEVFYQSLEHNTQSPL